VLIDKASSMPGLTVVGRPTLWCVDLELAGLRDQDGLLFKTKANTSSRRSTGHRHDVGITMPDEPTRPELGPIIDGLRLLTVHCRL